MEQQGRMSKIQVFGTDLDDSAVLTRFDQGRETERAEVGVGKPDGEGFAPRDVPGATAAAGRTVAQSFACGSGRQWAQTEPWSTKCAPDVRNPRRCWRGLPRASLAVLLDRHGNRALGVLGIDDADERGLAIP
jgi:hypothetical protein